MVKKDLLWRLRDELIYRKGSTRNGKYYKSKGGFFKSKDKISRIPSKILFKRERALTQYRYKKYGNADT